MSNDLQIVLIIPVRNRKDYTQNILTQLTWQIKQGNRQGVSIIVVDDGSTDGTKEMIQTQFSSVFLIEADGSLWWAGTIVKGMKHALDQFDSDYIVWLNDDLVIAENFIKNLIKICSSAHYQDIIVGGIVLDKTYSDWIVYSGLRNRQPISHLNNFASSSELEVDALCGNIVVISRKIVDKIGFPDCVKLPHHGSDYEYIMRAKKAGFKAIVSCKIQANTDYTLNDFIRYMPYWMQWYLQPNFYGKFKIIQGLTTLKSNQNIWLIVNLHSDNRDKKNIPIWNYIFCYINKILRFMMIEFLSNNYVESRIKDYLASQNPPQDIVEKIIEKF